MYRAIALLLNSQTVWPCCPSAEYELMRKHMATELKNIERFAAGSPLRRGHRATDIYLDKLPLSSASSATPIISNPQLPPPQFADTRSPTALDGEGFVIGIVNRCGRDWVDEVNKVDFHWGITRYMHRLANSDDVLKGHYTVVQLYIWCPHSATDLYQRFSIV